MMGQSLWLWIVFNVFILTFLALDLGFFHKERRVISVREALWTCAGYIAMALAFNVGIYYFAGPQPALEFLTGYFIEYALSMDNILVFVLILAHFRVPPEYQMRVLIWGIIGALVLRGIFIYLGAALLEQFHWVILVFGVFLLLTGLKTLFAKDEAPDLEQNWVVRYSRKLLPVTKEYHGERFFVRDHAGKLIATPLFLVLIVLNFTDILFAVDSIPAIFAITRDPFIVYTSNVFALLGLRALYFALAGMLDKFRYLKIGISLVLVFIGFKMIFNYWENLPNIPTEMALVVTVLLIAGSIIASLIKNRTDPLPEQPPSQPIEPEQAKAALKDIT
jgi:tellurite resistance protein TerC